MQVQFIQGIISYPGSGNNQQFLNISNGKVSLSVAQGDVVVTFAYGNTNYLQVESASVLNAWTNIPSGTQSWLYWDINLQTAVRTFGFTTYEPVVATTAPQTPAADQHWFNTSTKKMYVYSNGNWTEVIRVFAATITATGAIQPVGSAGPMKPYAGTQVGIQEPAGVTAGSIIITDSGLPVRKSDGTFFTSADQFFTNSGATTTAKIEASIFTGTATQPIAAYQVVKFSSFGYITPALYDDEQTTIIAMTLENILTDQPGTLCMQGSISNPTWNWTTVGAPLWVHGTIPGTLTDVDPHVADSANFPVSKPPVARVVTPTSIFFDQGLGGKGDKGEPGVVTNIQPATTTSIGLVSVTVAPTDPTNPIVVSTLDPRMSDARTPLPHTQAASTVTITPSGNITGPTAQDALQQLDTNKVSRSGDTMTGPLILNADPTVSLGAATKQYVDTVPHTISTQQDVTLTSPTAGQALIYNGTRWINSPTVSTVSVTTANGISGTVATSTTTPAITLTLGNITPGSVTASGNISSTGSVTAGTGGVITSDVTLSNAIGNVIQSNNLVTALHEIDDAMTNRIVSGHYSWTTNNPPYWSAVGNQFTVLQGGTGYIQSRKITWAGPQTVTIPSNSTLLVYVDVTGTVQAGVLTPILLESVVPLFLAFHDGINLTVVREDHDYSFGTEMVNFIHSNIGTILQGEGAVVQNVTIGTGTVATDREVKIVGSDTVIDGDINTIVPDSNGVGITWNWFYLNTSNLWTFYASQAEIPMVYSSAGTITPLTNGQYCTATLYVSKDNSNTPSPTYFAVIDHAVYPSFAAADNALVTGTNAEATNELEALQIAKLGYVIVQKNAAGGFIVATISDRSTFGSRSLEAASNTATLTQVDAALFTNILNITDTTVQSALNTLDVHTHSASSISSGILPISFGGTNSGTALNNNRVMKSSGGSIVEAAAITPGYALISDANGIPTQSAVTSLTLSYLDATSSVQTQLNTKALDSAVIKKDGSVVYTAAQSMGGFKITNVANGTVGSDAVNKSQLDALSLGFNPQISIYCDHVTNDSLATPPASPVYATAFIVPAGATGVWTGLAGHLMEWQGGPNWVDVLGRAIVIGDRFGINFENIQTAAGSFTGYDRYVVQVTNATPGSYAYTFIAPVNSYLELIDVSNCIDTGHSFAYNSSIPEWVEISAPVPVNPGTALSRTGLSLNVNVDATSVSTNGSNQLTVIAVGGSSAANIHTAELAANAATNLNTASTIVKRDASGNFSAGTITANLTGNVSGSAATFTGSLSGDVTGTQSSTVVSTVGGSSATNIHTAELKANAATNLNTASTIVLRDSFGNFSAGTITANLTGNVSGSATSFTGSLSGDVTGSQSSTVVATVGGSTATNIHTAELAANAATNLNTASTIVKRDASGNFSAGTITANLSGNVSGSSASFTGSLLGDVTGTQSATVVSTVGGSSAANIHTAELAANAATNLNTASTIVLRDASGNFSAGTITANLSGTATTATNIAGGTTGSMPYQTGSGTTTFLNTPSQGQVLVGGGTAPKWLAAGTSGYVLTAAGVGNDPTWTAVSGLSTGTATTATNIAGGLAGEVPYQTGPGATSFTSVGTAGQVLTSNGSSAPTWTSLNLSSTESLVLTGITTPGAATGTPVGSGGTLAAGTNFARIVAVDVTGTTTAAGPENPGGQAAVGVSGVLGTGLQNKSILFDSVNNVVWTCNTVGTLQKWSALTGTLLATYTLGLTSVWDIEFDPLTNSIWIAQYVASNAIVKFNIGTGTITATVSSSYIPSIAYDSYNRVLWVTDNNGHIGFINPRASTPTVIAYVTTVALWSLYVDTTNNAIWGVTNGSGVYKVSIGPKTYIQVSTAPTSYPLSFAYDAAENAMWIYGGANLYKFNASTNVLINSWAIANSVSNMSMCYDPTQSAVYLIGAVDASHNYIRKYDAATGNLLNTTTVNVGTQAYLAFDPVHNIVWSASFGGSMYALNAATFSYTTSTGVTTVANGSINWVWNAVPNAVSYQIWCSTTTGTEAYYFTSNTNSFTQTAPATSGTPGTLPTVNATGTIALPGVLTSTVATGTAPFIVNSTTPVANLSIGGTATNATNVGTTAVTTNATFYPTFVSATTGNNPVDVATNLTFNPGTGALTSSAYIVQGTSGTPNAAYQALGTGTAISYYSAVNTSGKIYMGVESSTGSAMITGTTAYDAFIRAGSGLSFSANDGTSLHMRLSSTGALAVTGGVNNLTTTTGIVNVAAAAAPSIGQVLTATSATTATWQTPSGGGATITDDTATNATRYPLYAAATSGSLATAYTASTKYYFNPSTGTLSATNFTSLSDANYKTDVNTLTNAMDMVSQLRGVSFKWKDTRKPSYGVIAQEIEQVLPAVVVSNDHGQKTVDYLTIIAFLIESVKELNVRITELENK